MKRLGIAVLGCLGVVVLWMFVRSLLLGQWLPMGVAGAALVALGFGMVTMLRRQVPAITEPGIPGGPLTEPASGESSRTDGASDTPSMPSSETGGSAGTNAAATGHDDGGSDGGGSSD